MNIALITQRNFDCCHLANPLRKAAHDLHYDFSVEKIFIEDVIVSWENGKVALLYNNENILFSFSVFFFRLHNERLLEKAYFIARTAKENGKLLINESYSTGNTYDDKLSILPLLQRLHITHPKTMLINSPNQVDHILNEFTFPFITKDPYGWQGESVCMIHDTNDAESIKTNFPKSGLLAQEHLPIDNDIRVIVVGYKALGAIARKAPEGTFKTNLSAGGFATQIPLTEEMRSIAECLAKETRSALLGIDFISHKGKLYVLEIETCPGFNGFRKATNLSPASEILAFIHDQQGLP